MKQRIPLGQSKESKTPTSKIYVTRAYNVVLRDTSTWCWKCEDYAPSKAREQGTGELIINLDNFMSSSPYHSPKINWLTLISLIVVEIPYLTKDLARVKSC